MKIGVFKNVKDYFSDKFKKIEKSIQKDTKELYKIEDDIKNLKIESKESMSAFVWTDRRMIKFWFFALLVGVLGYFIFNTMNFVFMVISSYIVSMIVESLIVRFQNIGLKRGLSIFFAYLVFILVLFLLFIIVVPFLINQTIALLSVGVDYLISFQKSLAEKGFYDMFMGMDMIPSYFKEYFDAYFGDSNLLVQIQNALQQNLSEIISLGKNYITRFGVIIINFISGFTNFLIDFGIFITLAILFSVEKNLVVSFLSKIGGKEHRETTYLKIKKMYKKLAVWLKARLLMSLFISVAMRISLLIMGWFGIEIPNKLGISVFTGLLDIIPYVGPFISAAILFVVGLLYNSIWVAIIAIGILYVVNMIQNSILTPLFMNKALGVSSVLIFISMILGGMIMGFFGVLLAVPIAVIITLMFQDKKQLNKKEKEYSISKKISKTKDSLKKKISGKK